MGYHQLTEQLTELAVDQPIVFGGDRVTRVSAELADAFSAGDRLLVDDRGELLHIPAAEQEAAASAVAAAAEAFEALAACSDQQITHFFGYFADRLADDATFDPIRAANDDDIARARQRGRSTTRLALDDRMRADMIDGLAGWAADDRPRHRHLDTVEHHAWSVEAWRAPLGVVGFVFEGRPNVFADAAGVLRTGNTVVFRIGSDALGTADAIAEHALAPALEAAGLPAAAVGLVRSSAHAAGWALFADARLALAVARGSGPAVAQLGSVARQAGNAVSLHGTGGAWVVADRSAPADRLAGVIEHSLDRKVCNTLNTLCVTADDADRLLAIAVDALDRASNARGVGGRLHVTERARQHLPDEVTGRTVTVRRADGDHREAFVSDIDVHRLGHEWEWESSPEISVHVVDDVDEATSLFNRYSPRFVAALISDELDVQQRFYERIDAPFVGDGFTRWVDGQYALDQPELGLSNWEFGRLLGRSGILSGDSVYTVRYRARHTDATQRR